MNKKERIAFITETLDHLFPNPPIPLNHTNAYTFLIAVLLSAQCTDARVNIVTKDLFAKYTRPFLYGQVGIGRLCRGKPAFLTFLKISTPLHSFEIHASMPPTGKRDKALAPNGPSTLHFLQS